jgi:uncharacterized protein (DUF885 family)
VGAYKSFVADFHSYLTRDPNACVFKGIDARLDQLPDPGAANIEARVQEGRDLLGRADALNLSDWDFDDLIDLDLARLTLKASILEDTWTFNGRTRAQQKPTAGDDIGDGIFQMFVNDPREPEARLESILARIEKIPLYLTQLLGRLDTPVQRWLEIDLEKVRELPGLLKTIIDWAKAENWVRSDALEAACANAGSAMSEYCTALENLPTTRNFHLGRQTAEALVASRGIELSLEQIHKLAKDFLVRNRDRVETLRHALVARYGLDPNLSVAETQSWLKKKYAVKVEAGQLEQVLDRYQDERERILAWIRERDLFPILPDQDMKILRTPAFMAPSIPAGAMMAPPAFREGTRTSMVYLTLSEDLLEEHTEVEIPLMMIHEGIPGHHLQLATASTHDSVIRRHFDALEHAEGWTTMLEDYMLDQGYMGDLTDEARFCGALDLARIGARVAIDLFFLTGEKHLLDVGVDCDLSSDDPFVAAGNLLQAVTGFTPGRVQAELNWYSQERGYPMCYLIGNHLVWALKKDADNANSQGRSPQELDREFHRVYLESGNMPLSFLRKVMAHDGLI